MKRFFWLIPLCFITSCGGGGGDDNILPEFQGVWDATIHLSNNKNCRVDIPQTISDVLTVNQVQEEVAVVYSDGTIERGGVDGEDSFTVEGEEESENCVAMSTTRFTGLDGNQADIFATIDFTCRSGTCTLDYAGSATRR